MIKRTFGIILVFTLLTSAIVLFFLNSSSGVSMAPASCNAEYLNQIYDVNAFDKGKTFYTACTVGNNVTTNTTCYGVNNSNIDSFTVPLNYPYGKVSIINASILARCTLLNISFFCPYFINGHLCGAFGSGNITGIGGMQVYPISCLQYIRPGINVLQVASNYDLLTWNPYSIYENQNATISKVFVEMAVTPANC